MRSWCLLPLQYTRRPSERRPCGCRTPAAVSRVGLLDVTPRRCGRRDMGIGWPVSQAPPPLIPVMGLAYRDRAVDDQRQVMRRITVRFEDAVTRPDCKDNRLAGDGESPGRASWTWHPWMIRRRDRRSALVLVLDVCLRRWRSHSRQCSVFSSGLRTWVFGSSRRLLRPLRPIRADHAEHQRLSLR
jgi:hypothetical protein